MSEKVTFVDALIDEFVPKEHEFTVTLSGRDLRFKVIASYDELQALRKSSATFLKSLRKGAAPAGYKEFIPGAGEDGDATALTAFVLSKSIIEPEIGVYEFLKLAAKAPFVFEHIRVKVDEGQFKANAEIEAESIDEAKKK